MNQLMPGDIAVNHFDLYLFMTCSLRYAMGRESTVVAGVCDVFRRHWSDLSDMERSILRGSLREELDRAERRGKKLGRGCDDRDWRALLEFMTRPIPRRS